MTLAKQQRMVDWSALEQEFKDATGRLPDYKRTQAWAYVKALADHITVLQKELNELATEAATMRRGLRDKELATVATLVKRAQASDHYRSDPTFRDAVNAVLQLTDPLAASLLGTPLRTFRCGVIEQRSAGEVGIVEWTPGRWWAVEVTGPDGSFTPLYEGVGADAAARRDNVVAWLQARQPHIARAAAAS